MKGNDCPQANCFDVEVLNHCKKTDEAELIDAAERAYEGVIERTAEQYLSHRKEKRMILVSGPSGSGKTTTSYRLTDELKRRGLNPVVISLDNFFLEFKKLPLNRDGSPRYDSVQALDLSLLNRTIWSLVYRGEAQVPNFNFVKSKAEGENLLRLERDSVVLLEGIHALNPLVTYGLDYDSFFKICMDVDSAFYVRRELLFSSREIRFLRRSIRDFKHRGASIRMTYGMWPGVCEGENMFIKPFYPYADTMLNTIHCYEPLVYKPLILPMLKEVAEDPQYGVQAKELYRKMLRFDEIETKKVPSKSLLQEFIG